MLYILCVCVRMSELGVCISPHMINNYSSVQYMCDKFNRNKTALCSLFSYMFKEIHRNLEKAEVMTI